MRRRTEYYCRIDVTPIAGVLGALWLLFAVMLPGPDMSIWRSVELVNASRSVPIPAALRDDAIIVGVSASGDVYFGSRHISLKELGSKIPDNLKVGSEDRVYLIVDSRAKYADLISLFPPISSAKIENVTFITR